MYMGKCLSLLFLYCCSQTCRGHSHDNGVIRQATTYSEEGAGENNNVLVKTIPAAADFLMAYATPPGFAAFRDSDRGSPFIQALAYLLDSQGVVDDLLSLLTKVIIKQKSKGQRYKSPSFGLT